MRATAVTSTSHWRSSPSAGSSSSRFLGAVRAHIGEAEDKFFATIVLGSGLLFIAMLFVFGALFGALISLAGLYDGDPPLALWRLGREFSFNIAIVYAMRVGAVFMLSSSVIAFRLRIHARPVVVFGFVGAIVLLFASPTTPWLQLVFPFGCCSSASTSSSTRTGIGTGGSRRDIEAAPCPAPSGSVTSHPCPSDDSIPDCNPLTIVFSR